MTLRLLSNSDGEAESAIQSKSPITTTRGKLLEKARAIYRQERLLERWVGLEIAHGSRLDEANPFIRATLQNMMAMIAREANNAQALELAFDEDTRLKLDAIDIPKMLETLETRFKSDTNRILHPGLSWERVCIALEATPKALLTLAKMEAAGHEPDIYNFDQQGFDVGTCSRQVPESTRNCVYNNEAKASTPGANSAEEMTTEIGVELMDDKQYTLLQSHIEQAAAERSQGFDVDTVSFLHTSTDLKEIAGEKLVCIGSRDTSLIARINMVKPTRQDKNMGWRGSFRVNWAA